MELTIENVGADVDEYVAKLVGWSVPELPRQPVPFFLALKRGRVTGGPYPGVSVFELANRVMSDLVVLFAARQLLLKPPSRFKERIVRVQAALGTTQGLDLEADFESGARLAGECFNVSPSFFNAKHAMARRALRKVDYPHKLIAFNSDAVRDPAPFIDSRRAEFSYLLVDVAGELASAARH
jgi:hypothetical protein